MCIFVGKGVGVCEFDLRLRSFNTKPCGAQNSQFLRFLLVCSGGFLAPPLFGLMVY